MEKNNSNFITFENFLFFLQISKANERDNGKRRQKKKNIHNEDVDECTKNDKILKLRKLRFANSNTGKRQRKHTGAPSKLQRRVCNVHTCAFSIEFYEHKRELAKKSKIDRHRLRKNK